MSGTAPHPWRAVISSTAIRQLNGVNQFMIWDKHMVEESISITFYGRACNTIYLTTRRNPISTQRNWMKYGNTNMNILLLQFLILPESELSLSVDFLSREFLIFIFWDSPKSPSKVVWKYYNVLNVTLRLKGKDSEYRGQISFLMTCLWIQVVHHFEDCDIYDQYVILHNDHILVKSWRERYDISCLTQRS